MSLGVSLFLIAVGAILHWAVTATVSGIDIQVVGTILMIVGVLGFLISLALYVSSRNSDRPATRRREPASWPVGRALERPRLPDKPAASPPRRR